MSFCASPLSLQFHASKPLSLRFRACAADVPDFLSADCCPIVEKNASPPFSTCSADLNIKRIGALRKPCSVCFSDLPLLKKIFQCPFCRCESRRKRPLGPRLSFSAEEAVKYQLDALMFNDQPRPDYGIEVMYRFAGFDPFERSTYFGPFFDLGQFERFRRIFHHSSYRVLLGHWERKTLSSLHVKENCYKQRVWIRELVLKKKRHSSLPMVQVISRALNTKYFSSVNFPAKKVGGSWDGYWLTESLLHDGDSFSGGVAY